MRFSVEVVEVVVVGVDDDDEAVVGEVGEGGDDDMMVVSSREEIWLETQCRSSFFLLRILMFYHQGSSRCARRKRAPRWCAK